jgi:hypothetical protein
MNGPNEPNLPARGQFLVYQAEDGRMRIDVRLENETAWLTQSQMAELFQTTIPNVCMHIRNVFAEGELQADSVIQEFLTTAADGKNYTTKYYNLDAIISIGYRVKSAVATRFRIWATQKLREFTRIPPQTDSTSRPSWGRFRQGHQTIVATIQAEEGRQEVKSGPAIPDATALCLPSRAGRRAGDEGAQRARDLEQTTAGNLRRTRDLRLPRLLSGQVQLETEAA